MAHLSPSAIFSPTVARKQLAAARDWSYVDGWLNAQFNGKTLPPFERNPETLKALLALASLNETLDEEREILVQLESKALQELQASERADLHQPTILSLETGLTPEGRSSLEALSTLSVLLNQPIPDAEDAARCIIDLQSSIYETEQIYDRCTTLDTSLDAELQYASKLTREVQTEPYHAGSNIAKEAIEFQRKAKGLTSRIPELQDRVVTLSSKIGHPPNTIQAIQDEEDRFKSLMGEIKALEDEVKAYHGLPQDTDLARLELEAARFHLHDLSQQRDKMFEGLVEKGSPMKSRS